jgi:filamentous hemagglutinin family protein
MMTNFSNCRICRTSIATLSLLTWQLGGLPASANPTGGSAAPGTATFSSSGSQFTINQTAANAVINWHSFDIGLGETTTFVQPSSSSIAWNQINSPNASQILGTLNANGYVILDNQAGFYVGGAAAINAHGLIMTTTPSFAPNFSSGGAWEFDAPPPTASIINYGQINIAGGGTAYLIANTIQNNGTISAPQGNIGLYAGQQVLVSTRPDGHGLSAKVTLPQGSVNNQGQLIADAGSIFMQAQTVNQSGTVQANTVQNVNGTIELLASDSVNLGAGSVISAQGAAAGTSSGGTVTIKSDNSFSDQAGSSISVAGGKQGGNGGQVEISASQMSSIQSVINGQAAVGFAGGALTIDPANIWLTSIDNDLSAPAGYTAVNFNDYIGLSINVVADNNIQLKPSTIWSLAATASPATLTLSAGNSIILNVGSAIVAPNNWTLDLFAGTSVPSGTMPAHVSDHTQSDGIYLLGTAAAKNGAYLQTQNGDINCTAANEVWIGDGKTTGGGAIRTLGGGNIDVTAIWGNVNTGTGTGGYIYYGTAPYYTPFTLKNGQPGPNSTLSGISTAAGGNVTINAINGSVTSFPAGSSSSGTDAGSGAFGSQAGQVGNLTINAQNVYGHYVVADGTGAINANQNIGSLSQNVALSLVKGRWILNAPNGNIYLQEVRNPNGTYNNVLSGSAPSAGYNYFNYYLDASVNLDAYAIYLTGATLQRQGGAVPVIYPPILDITAGAGGLNLGNTLILFPSVDQNLNITDAGVLNGNGYTLSMSDTPRKQWVSGSGAFTVTDTGSTPLGLNNPNPVLINVSGDMDNLNLVTDKRTIINVDGNLNNCSFSGENLHASDVTSITVAGQIFNQGSFTWTFLSQGVNNLPSTDWVNNGIYNFLALLYAAVDPTKIAADTESPTATTAQIKTDAVNALLISPGVLDSTFTFDPTTGRLTLIGLMSDATTYGPNHQTLESLLYSPLTVLKTDGNGNPLVINGKFQTETITSGWISQAASTFLHDNSQNALPLNGAGYGYTVGGPGTFDVQAVSIFLGNSIGFLTEGVGNKSSINRSYAYLAPYTPSGADLNVTVTGSDPIETVNGSPTTVASLDMPASTIAALGGGNVTVVSENGSMDLGSQDLLSAATLISGAHLGGLPLGIYATGPGNVTVTALGDVNIDSSRIAAFDGGNVSILSYQGNVNAGSGGANASALDYFYVDPATKMVVDYGESLFANGIVANTLSDTTGIPGAGSLPGNITVTTPQGDINADQGGITQEALNGNTAAGPIITLSAGSPGHTGNINLGNSGVIGGSVFATANGNISGLVISRQDSTINAAQNFSGTVLAGGTATLAAGGSVSGTIAGLGGVNASGANGVSATLLGNNVSVNGGATQNTLGATATATSTSQSAAGEASNEAKQQVASNDNGNDDKKKTKKGALMRRVKRVTVILPQKA